MLSVGFLAAALLTVLGFFLYALFSFRRRFIEMGVLRAVGLSAGQMTVFLASELAFLIVVGAGLLALGPAAVIEKRGEHGARIHLASGERIDAPGFPVEVYNILGAGDAFGAGFLYGYVKGWSWYKAVRLGNACGAIVVTKHGCANFMPTMDEGDLIMPGETCTPEAMNFMITGNTLRTM